MALSQETAKVTLLIKGVSDEGGKIKVSFANSPENFFGEDNPGIIETVHDAEAGETVLIIDDVPFGEYGISIFHDKDSNGELDTNFFGMPKEGFGFSNNPKSSFGPPDYEQTVITVDGSQQTYEILLKYL